MKENKKISWALIITLWIIFWPLAIYFTYKKMVNEKTKYVENGKSLRKFGYFFFGFAIFIAVVYMLGGTEESPSTIGDAIIVLIVFGSFGLPFYLIGNNYIGRGKRYKTYISMINKGDLSIDSLSNAVGLKYEKTVDELQKMFDDGFYRGSIIDENGRIVLLQPNSNDDSISNISFISNQKKAVKCPNCGATCNVIVGVSNECEYCGTPLE